MTALQEFTQRYVYLTDEFCFYDLIGRKNIARESLQKKAAGLVGYEKAPGILQDIIDLSSTTKDILKSQKRRARKAGRTEGLEEAYQNLAPNLPLLRFASPTAPVLYTVDERRQVTYVGQSDHEAWSNIVASKPELVRRFRAAQAAYAPEVELTSFIIEMYKFFRLDPDKNITEPPQVLSWSSEKPAFKVMDASVLVPGPHPTWDEFLARTSDASTFRAYVWSIFEPQNTGRQALWLQGEGGDGKSTVLRVLARFLGESHTLTIGLDTYNSDFFNGAAYGKRFAIYPDCKNLSVLRKERIKSMLGNDLVEINNKYEKQFSARIYAKLMVASNWMPQINYLDDSERTRLLVCKVQSYGDEFGDPDFEEKLYSEMGAFLVTCQKDYEKQCPKKMNLIVPPRMREVIKTECSALDGVILQNYVQDYLEFDPSYTTEKAKLYASLKSFFHHNNYSNGDVQFAFNDLGRLLGKKKVVPEGGDGSRYKGVRIRNDFTNKQER